MHDSVFILAGSVRLDDEASCEIPPQSGPFPCSVAPPPDSHVLGPLGDQSCSATLRIAADSL